MAAKVQFMIPTCWCGNDGGDVPTSVVPLVCRAQQNISHSQDIQAFRTFEVLSWLDIPQMISSASVRGSY
jgi:hypothetical protein